MTDRENHRPVYDEKVQRILKGLKEGKSREELAVELGYSSYKSLDMYIRRRNFRWDKKQSTYLPRVIEVPLVEEEAPPPPTKERLIVSLFKSTMDPKEIAVKMGFTDHRELASFMREKGYVWSGEMENYVPQVSRGFEDKVTVETDTITMVPAGDNDDQQEDASLTPDQFSQLHKYVPLLSFLEKNRGSLERLLIENRLHSQGLLLNGDVTLVNICMSRLMGNILQRYSVTKGLSQREVVEGALVEYFLRYSLECLENSNVEDTHGQ